MLCFILKKAKTTEQTLWTFVKTSFLYLLIDLLIYFMKSSWVLEKQKYQWQQDIV